jgi:hypothetical protein
MAVMRTELRSTASADMEIAQVSRIAAAWPEPGVRLMRMPSSSSRG